jgi:DNA-binding IclR family transcriptional regulator
MAVSGGQICSADDIAKTAGLPRSRVRKMVTKLLASGDMIRGWNGILAFVGAVHE